MSIYPHLRGLALLALALSLPASPAHVETPGKVPSIVAVPGIPNFHQVDEHVFRGGQPTSEAWPNLAKIGVKTVIDLCREDEHSTAQEAQAVAAAGMTYINIPMKGVVAPKNDEIVKVLTLLNSQDPVFVHCHRGADRTGAVIACYRIAHDRWDRKQAVNEAKAFGMAWTQQGLKHYIMTFQPAL
jgi:tyrosine-protein phosphatase SIW14